MEALRRNPGMSKRALAAAVGLSWATTTYHLDRLAKAGAVELVRFGRRDIQCFPAGVPHSHRRLLAALREQRAALVLAALTERDVGVRELAMRLGLSESATRRRLQSLCKDGIVVRQGVLRPRFSLSPQGRDLAEAPGLWGRGQNWAADHRDAEGLAAYPPRRP
ncbi:MAG: winged helix-turn-helix transcriptional regulator [Thermoplasmatota archaeon]